MRGGAMVLLKGRRSARGGGERAGDASRSDTAIADGNPCAVEPPMAHGNDNALQLMPKPLGHDQNACTLYKP